jgi:hypothetical protein
VDAARPDVGVEVGQALAGVDLSGSHVGVEPGSALVRLGDDMLVDVGAGVALGYRVRVEPDILVEVGVGVLVGRHVTSSCQPRLR